MMLLHLKAYLIKVDRDTLWFDVVEIPRWMTKRERESFERERRAKFADYCFTLAYDVEDVVFKMMGADC